MEGLVGEKMFLGYTAIGIYSRLCFEFLQKMSLEPRYGKLSLILPTDSTVTLPVSLSGKPSKLLA